MKSWQPRFVADADLNERIIEGLRRRVPAVDIVRLRDLGMQASSDPQILAWAADADRILLTHDRKTVPGHSVQRLRQGLPLAGVVVVPQRIFIGSAIDDLVLLASAGEQEDFANRVIYLPL